MMGHPIVWTASMVEIFGSVNYKRDRCADEGCDTFLRPWSIGASLFGRWGLVISCVEGRGDVACGDEESAIFLSIV